MANDIGSDRVRFYLVVWKGWMMSHDNGLGYPKKAAMCTGAGKRQFDEFCDALDLQIAEAQTVIGIVPEEFGVVLAINARCASKYNRTSSK